MKARGISQEALKLLACITMLLDHAAAVLVLNYDLYIVMRSIGRIAFPIYCFLIAEGAHYTRSPGKYALRLAVGAVLSELPFDLALFGGLTMRYQSVMLTLLLGFGAVWGMKQCKNYLLKILIALPFILLGDVLCTDYGSHGVLMVALLGLARDLPYGKFLQMAAIALCCAMIPSANIRIGDVVFSMELLGILSLVPIALYHGKKRTQSKAIQWAFYLFYPVHLAILSIFA